jgi:hypothetical protein
MDATFAAFFAFPNTVKPMTGLPAGSDRLIHSHRRDRSGPGEKVKAVGFPYNDRGPKQFFDSAKNPLRPVHRTGVPRNSSRLI